MVPDGSQGEVRGMGHSPGQSRAGEIRQKRGGVDFQPMSRWDAAGLAMMPCTVRSWACGATMGVHSILQVPTAPWQCMVPMVSRALWVYKECGTRDSRSGDSRADSVELERGNPHCSVAPNAVRGIPSAGGGEEWCEVVESVTWWGKGRKPIVGT